MNPQDLNVFIVDDDPGVCKAWGHVLLSHGYAVKTFESGEAFLGSPRLDQGGCVLLDLRMEPGISGLQVFDELRRRDSPLAVIFLSGHGTVQTSVQAMKEGATDWLEKPSAEAQVLDAVNRALSRSASEAARRSLKAQRMALWQALTPRQADVAGLVRLGKANKDIARSLNIPSPRTVESHRAHVYLKLDLDNPAELDRFMRDMDL